MNRLLVEGASLLNVNSISTSPVLVLLVLK